MTDNDAHDRLVSFVNAWTRRLGPPAPRGARERLIACPPRLDWDAALRALQRELTASDESPIRLVALGATIEDSWPRWLREVRRPVLVTELDAYFPRERAALIAARRPALERWLDTLFADALPGLQPSRVFWSAACDRLFAGALEEQLLLTGLRAAARGATLISPDEHWQAALDERPAKPVAGRTQLLGRTAAYEVAAVARRAWQYWRERSTRAALRARRVAAAAPPLWLALYGAWPRSNRPLPEVLGPLARARGATVGVLLQRSLESGVRGGGGTRTEPAPPLVSLDVPELEGVVATVEQGVSSESVTELARTLAGALIETARAATRIGSGAVSLRVDPAAPLPLDSDALARLLSVELLGAREAWAATRRLLRRRPFSGETVIWAHATAANDAATIQLLRNDGAQTVEVVHGLTEPTHAVTSGRTFTDVKLMWSTPEATTLSPLEHEQRILGGFMPRPRPTEVPLRGRAGGRPLRVLLASSYLVSGWGVDPRITRHYQAPFLEEGLALLGRDEHIELRWRPHPGDDAEAVRRFRTRYPRLAPSPGTPDEELRWCDLLVTSYSSLIIEGLEYGIPIFVHEVPRWDDRSYAPIAPARRFGLHQRLDEAVSNWLAAAPDVALAEEHALAATLFPRGRRNIDEALPLSARNRVATAERA